MSLFLPTNMSSYIAERNLVGLIFRIIISIMWDSSGIEILILYLAAKRLINCFRNNLQVNLISDSVKKNVFFSFLV